MKKRIILMCALCLFVLSGAAQKKLGVYAAGFYNLENLFDTEDDPNNPRDNDFLPDGPYHWTPEKYQQKLHNLARVISKMAHEVCPAGPAILGVAEVENRRVLEDLVKTPPLAQYGYKVIHFDSPDRRGIDVGCLYNPKLFKVTDTRVYPYVVPNEPNFKSRDQLVVTGVLADTPFTMIVNHWPSRYGGDKSSIYREIAAGITKHIADSIRTANPEARILIVGDLNDDPNNKSVKDVLKATEHPEDAHQTGFFNTTWPLFDRGIGSLCYQGKWNLFDQLIISDNLLTKDRNQLSFWKSEIFNRDMVTQQEGKYKGYPWRTFEGNTFINGFSDHFPSIIYFVKRIQKGDASTTMSNEDKMDKTDNDNQQDIQENRERQY